MDPRKQYIIGCIETLLKIDSEKTKGLVKSEIIDNFLNANDQGKQTVNIIYLPGKGFKVYKFGENYPQDGQIINMTKVTGEFITEDNVSKVISFNIMPIDVMKVLQTQLENFFIPALKGSKDQQICKQMEELKQNIDNTLSGGNLGDDDDEVGNNKDKNIKYIYKPADEFDYWIKKYSQASGEKQSERAKYFSDLFNTIDKQFRDIRIVEINGIKELCDQTIDVCDKIWVEWRGEEYPEIRMKKFIEICGNTFISRVQLEFKGDEIWDISKTSVRLKLNECVRFLKYWQDNLELQIKGSWQNIRPIPEIDYDNIQGMVNRINEILELRNQYEELNKIASINKTFSTNFKETFSIFKGINALNSTNTEKWSQAKSKYSLQMEEIEEEIVKFLKQELFQGQNTKENPIQVIREMQGWHGLMNRPGVMKTLQNERSSVLVSLLTITEKIRSEFDSRSSSIFTEQDDEYSADGIPSGHNFSKVLNAIIYTRQLIGKVKKVMSISSNLLNDLKEYGAFQEFSEQLVNSMKDFENEQFDYWKQQILDKIESPENELSLQMTGRLMELNLSSGLLQVNYSERLVLLIRETRQLFELGFRKQIDKKIIDIVETGKKFYKEALSLKQVANFYNTMSSQIIESQKKMLIDQAVEFEEVVAHVKENPRGGKQQNQLGKITWDNTQQLENYIQRVQQSANSIMNENRRLRKIHLKLIELTSQLFEVDLIKDRQIWLEKLDVIQRNIDLGCQNKDPKMCRVWKVHWDFQLYKALEHQYQRGLQTIDNSLNEINCDVVLKGNYIGFRPNLVELKDKYYKEIKNFISWPTKSYKGIGGNQDIFRAMAERNSEYIGVVYIKGEQLFQKLERVLDQFQVWLAIGFLDFESLKGKMKNIEDWEFNIKNIRKKRKDLERLPDFQKVDCFNVNIGAFKQQASDQLQNLIESMTYSLKDTLENEVQEIEAFANIAIERLMKKPESKDEIHEAKENYFQIKSQKREKQRLMDSVETKNKLLRNLQGIGLNISSTQKKWENFEVSIADYDKILSEQTESIKADISKRTQKTVQEIEKFYARWQSQRPEQQSELEKEVVKELSLKMKDWKSQWDVIEGEAKKIKEDCEHFDMDPPVFDQLERVATDVKEYQGQWDLYDKFSTELEEFEKMHWVVLRSKLYEFQDFYMKWNDQLIQIENKDEVITYMIKQIDNFKQMFPLLKLMHGGDGVFKDDHWRDLFGLVGIDKKTKIEDLTFGDFVNVEENIIKNAIKIKDLQARAQGEVVLRMSIVELTNWIETYEFEFTDYVSNNRTTPLIKEWKDMLTKVSDNQSLLASIKESKYYHRFQDQIENFERKIGGVDEYLSKLQIIQRKWVYLEPIFGRGALPQEQHRFRRLDEDYRTIMAKLEEDKTVASLCQIEGVGETLGLVLDQLERCQKALNEYLEEKRGKFPRFYFLGDDDLLEILGQSQNPQVIQMHLKKLFAGIHKVDFNKDNTKIISMISSAHEVVNLRDKVEIEEYVENWLSILSRNMQKTLQESLKQCLQEKTMEPSKYPSQILCISEEVRFTEKCIASIKSNQLPSYKQDLGKMLEKFTTLVGGAPQLIQLKLKALILDLIHHIEVVDTLITNQVSDLMDWYWFKQLKYRMNSGSLCEMIMCKASFDYTYEYQGNAPKLVHTPLTDKCYLTLTQGMSMGYGGNPYGPAGTGKTESVKALGNAFGRQVLVFNCDEGLDFKSMGRIFIGLVKCGAWGCFDEFNRLLEEQLSAISQQIQIIQWAIKERETSMNLLGSQVDVNKNSGIFVTLNPAGKGYGGRSKLPDNLKQLFRPVAMSAPDNELIAETLLYAEGFKHASILAQKVISVFTLSKQLLTQQIHYDWGLRALKTILTVAGQIIQSERKGGQTLTENQEAEILIKAIRINTMSKLTFIDMNKFVALMQDIFPGVSSKDIVYEQLTKSVEECLKEKQLDVLENQIQKIMQFYEATKQRMGVVLVGPSGCGKTTIWQTLKRAHEKMGQQVKTYIMNPKSMPRSQLLGLMNNDTREFTEGVLTSAARQVVKTDGDVLNWIINDGDIDPEWIESLNSVLDDNHLLTLPTGERISFGDNVNFIFETNDLSFASPATVSRMGMIFLNTEDISVKAVVNKWIKKQKEDMQPKFENLLDELFYQTLEYVSQFEDDQIVPTTRVGLVMNVLSQLPDIKTKRQFICQLARGFASNFASNLRSQIVSQIFQISGEAVVSDINDAPLDFYVKNNDQTSKFLHAPAKFSLGDFQDTEEPPILQTIGAQRDMDILKPWIDHCEPFIVCGPEGCGKSLLINSAFNELKKKIKIQITTIFCNAQTTASQIIQKLNQICTKATFANGRILRPKECNRLVLYLKDINLPKPDKYDTIQLIAFLQQMISHRGYYDESLEFIYLDEKIQIVASMAPSSTVGRHDLSSRFTANVRVLNVEYPSKGQLGLIYEEYANTLFSQKFNFDQQEAADMSKRYAKMLCELYKNIKNKFTVDEQRHYMFTPRNLTQIIFGIQRYDIKKGDPSSLFEATWNEVSKSFKDKLVSIESCRKFDNFLNQLFKAVFQFQMTPGIYFTCQPGSKTLLRLERPDYENLIQQGLLAFEREIKEMKLILLDEVLNMMSSLDRALSVPGGILLAGRPGIGRKSCVALVATMQRIKLVQPSTQRDYGLREFKKEIKTFLEMAAVENQPLVMYIEDHHLVQPEFLELLNSLISSGEIPGLYTQDEIEHLFQSPEEVRQEYYGKSLYEAFCARVKKQVRVVFSMDFTQENFASNCAANPALFTKCTVIWKHTWSKDSMNLLAKTQLSETLQKIDDGIRNEILNQFVMVHNTIDNASPQNFFTLLQTFKKIFNSKIDSKGSTAGHLKKGLDKLDEASNLVDQLNKEAQVKKVDLAKAQKIADNALQEISKAMTDAAERKQETEKIQAFLSQEEGKVVGQKTEVEQELQIVQPLIDEANNSVKDISKSNLDFLKGLKMPPQPIIDVMGGVIRVFGYTEGSWASIRKFLSQRSVLEQLLEFNPKSITADLRRDIDAVITRNPNSFKKDVIYKASAAAGPMADWLKAILQYSKVLEKVEPLMNELRKLDQKLEGSRKRLRECQQQLDQINKKVEQLKQDFGQKTSEAEKLKTDLQKAEEILEKANTLLGKLSEEQKRWKIQEKQIKQEIQSYPAFSVLSSAFTTYLSQGDEKMRDKMLTDWKGLTRSNDFEYLKFMSSESTMLKWKAEGLPSDGLSLENSVMIFETSQTPLLIDPNTQATEWLKTNLKANGNVEILNQQDPKFSNQLELAVKFGKTLVIQELDEVESILIPVIRKDLQHSGPRWVVQLGDKQVDYNENFKLYLCTRNSNIDIRPNTIALISVINYSVTQSGLEGKLLSIIINHEQPELEKKKQDLLENEEKLKIQLADLEKSLLEELASSSGNILENTVLLDSLNQTKSKSQIISKSLQESLQLQENLDKQREVYRTLAYKGANLFILIQDLKKVNNMYRFSLSYFINLFQKCLLVQADFSQMEEKLKQCGITLNKIIFNQIASSLFKADRLTFGLHLVNGMFPELFQQNEWDFLLGNTAVAMDGGQTPPKWASHDSQEAYSSFLKSLPKVASQINFNDREWDQWAIDQECENSIPETYKNRLSMFQQVLLVQIFRPERLQTSLNNFVCKSFQINSTSGSQLQFKQIFKNESSTTVPILFVVSSGSDPSTELEEFATQEIGRENFHSLSMGGNQNELALKMLREAALKGQWVCFQNLHLVTSWLPTLEKEFKMLEPHQNFRLWLTTEAHQKFPSILLETCFKVSYESPPGIKKNLQRTYQGWQNSVNFSGGPQIKTQIYFVLAWFHALMQERRTYIPQGWSKFYEFSYGDLKAGENIIENILQEDSKNINWQTLYGLFENAIYGGRIDGFFDNKVLRAYLEHYFSPDIVGGKAALPIGSTVPSTTDIKDVVQIINKISETDNPSLFGLPLNIDKAVQRFNTSQVIASLKIISRASSEDLKFDKEKWSQQLAPIINLWSQLYKQMSEGGQPQIKQNQLNSSDPIEAFVYLEASQAYQMLSKIENSISNLNNVLEGKGLLTQEIYNTGKQLMLGEVPSKWAHIWDGADLPNVWLKGFAKRVYSLKKWVEKTNQKSLLDDELNLSELFHPEVFLNALRQKCCRLIQKPLNEMKLVTSFNIFNCKQIVKLKGLQLQGCIVENGQFKDGPIDLPEFIPLQTIYISYIASDEPDLHNPNESGSFPIFTNSSREKFLVQVNLPNNGSLNQRIIAGVALFLSSQ